MGATNNEGRYSSFCHCCTGAKATNFFIVSNKIISRSFYFLRILLLIMSYAKWIWSCNRSAKIKNQILVKPKKLFYIKIPSRESYIWRTNYSYEQYKILVPDSCFVYTFSKIFIVMVLCHGMTSRVALVMAQSVN